MSDQVLGTFLSEASFWPTKEISVSAWVEHSPFAFWLMGTAAPATVVELGSHTGYSFFAFCQAAQALGLPSSLYAIDTWVGDEHAGFYGEEIFESVKAIAERDYADRAHLLRMTFDEARGQFTDGSIDLLHVDGRHFYEDVRHDVDTYLSALSDRGVMLLHDITVHHNEFGVHRLWDELKAEYATFAFDHCNGLGVVAVGSQAPEAIKALTQLSPDQADLVRAAYARLGAAVPTPWIVEPQVDAALRRLPQAESEAAQSREAAASALAQVASLHEQLGALRDDLDSAEAESEEFGERFRSTRELLVSAETELQRYRASRARLVESVPGSVLRVTKALTHPRSTAARMISGKGRSAGRARELFDAEWYGTEYPETLQSHDDLFAEFSAHGASAGRQPSLLFDPGWYARNNPDLAGLDPLALMDHYVRHGGAEGRSPHPFFEGSFYLEENPDIAAAGINPLLHYVAHGDAEGRRPNRYFDPDRYRELTDSVGFAARGYLESPLPRPVTTAGFDPSWYLATYPDAAEAGIDPLLFHLRTGDERLTTPDATNRDSARTILKSQWGSTRPLRSVRIGPANRITLVTDSVEPDHLFGGVATGLILAAEWANASGRSLRILTRHRRPSELGCFEVWKLAGTKPPNTVEFAFQHPDSSDVVDIADDDLWLTTSWWTTAAVRETVDPRKVVYLLQEDERVFYPAGDDSIRAWREMTNAAALTIVDSERLLASLIQDGAANLIEHGIAFEGSFAAFTEISAPRPLVPRRGLFFYSRPNNPRNAFGLGLQTLSRALERGVLKPDEWTLYCVGPGTPKELNIAGARTVVMPGLSWPDYRALLPEIHVGLCLMSTPHTSYPPLDLVAAGAQVVTNTWPGKTGLEIYGPRLLAAPPEVDALVDALRVADERSRAGTVDESVPAVLSRTWSEQLESPLRRLLADFGRV